MDCSSRSRTIAVNLPPEFEERLRAEIGECSTAAREAIAIELFRRGILSDHDLGQSLALDRLEPDALLKRHKLTEHALLHDDVDADVKSLIELLTELKALPARTTVPMRHPWRRAEVGAAWHR